MAVETKQQKETVAVQTAEGEASPDFAKLTALSGDDLYIRLYGKPAASEEERRNRTLVAFQSHLKKEFAASVGAPGGAPFNG